jgi:hypothetical protein
VKVINLRLVLNKLGVGTLDDSDIRSPRNRYVGETRVVDTFALVATVARFSVNRHRYREETSI